ncbi:protein TIFY 5A-like [Vicia villosa]|uniref:protein TIFY 5A-like n=1 Tax=Vicia villosa TaxID=3911 RepID=UPI00273ACCBA|nr:protein TIFY 5A-like [Vicia villosa]
MKKNLNLELGLFTPSITSNFPTSVAEESQYQPQQHRPLTIVYDGKVCVSDATENQARSILMLANKEMEERVRTPTGSFSEPSSPAIFTSNLYSPGTSLSMKKSLQRFLQKRKNRIQEASPYHFNEQN